jgi:hypothetical protein
MDQISLTTQVIISLTKELVEKSIERVNTPLSPFLIAGVRVVTSS